MFPPVPTGEDRSAITKFIDMFVDVTNARLEARMKLIGVLFHRVFHFCFDVNLFISISFCLHLDLIFS
jgi:hypothetical protein